PEKAKYCKGCEIIENLVLENNTIHNVFEPEKKSEARALHRQKNVLAIDDNPEVIELIRKNIGNDYNVVGLLNGEKAVAEARAMRPDIITLDIIMPRKDGWQVLQELKNTPETRDIPVIILSIVDDKRMGFSLGAAEYLVKPIDKQLLLQKLQHLEKGIPIKKVLVVDNEAEAIDLISGVLKEAGCRVCLAYSSQDAIAAIDKSKPDLVILNLTMPCSDGFDLIEYMKVEEEIKDIPLMLITPKDLSEDEIKDFNGRIQITVNKGIYSEEDLLEELKRTIAKL
ncbi:MAG: response regulator, partial [Desulfobulbaceae bacterium]|nr:response regulator [Desulfobulbaceae bacterium]